LWPQHRFLSPGKSSVFSRLVAYAKNDEDKEVVCCTRTVGDYAHTLYRARVALLSLSLFLSLSRCVRAPCICTHNNAYLLIRHHPRRHLHPNTATSDRADHPVDPTTLPPYHPPPPAVTSERPQNVNTQNARSHYKHSKNNHTAAVGLTAHLIIIYY